MEEKNINSEVKEEKEHKDEIVEETNENVNLDEENAEKLEDEEFESLKEDSEDMFKKVISELTNSNKKLENEFETVKDRLARVTAEYDNYRKRTAKEKEGIYTDACEDILKNMLPVLDNLERAISVDGDVDDLKKGIEMTIRQFNDSLEKLGVEEISTDGEFDPNLHNAVMHIEDENFNKNSVVEVFLKGYKKGDKVIRYSMVKVAN